VPRTCWTCCCRRFGHDQLDEDYQLWVKVPDLSKHYRLLIARCVAIMTPTPTAMAPTENKMKEFKEVG
jgi:hypothetical protein